MQSFVGVLTYFRTPKGRGSTLIERIVEAIVDSPHISTVNKRNSIPLVKSDMRRAMYAVTQQSHKFESSLMFASRFFILYSKAIRIKFDTAGLCPSRISAWCPPANFQSSMSVLRFLPIFSKAMEDFHPMRSMVSIQRSEKKRGAMQKKHHQPTLVNQPESHKGGLLGERLKEREEWVFFIERFAALEWKSLLLR
jgi:hypothetical protein